MVEKTCICCGFLKPHHAKGKCVACYNRDHYWANSNTRELKKECMREYNQNYAIMHGLTNTFSYGVYLRKQLGVM